MMIHQYEFSNFVKNKFFGLATTITNVITRIFRSLSSLLLNQLHHHEQFLQVGELQSHMCRHNINCHKNLYFFSMNDDFVNLSLNNVNKQSVQRSHVPAVCL